MEHAEIELLLGREIPYTGHKRLPERPIIGPCGTDFVDGRIVDSWFPSGVRWHRQALPLHARVEHPEDQVKDAVRAQVALWPALGHREVWQEKCVELGFGELDRNRCRCRLWCRGAHHTMASWKA